MAVAIPRGVQVVKRTNAKGQQTIRYRVRVKRSGGSVNQYFDEVQEAIEFLKTAKQSPAQAALSLIESESQADKERDYAIALAALNAQQATFDNLIQVYEAEVIEKMPDETELERRNKANRVSFIKTIRKTVIRKTIEIIDGGSHGRSSIKEDVRFADIPPEKVTRYDINAYIAARKNDGIRVSSISREIGIISKIFQECMKDEAWSEIQNPVKDYNKDLLREGVAHKDGKGNVVKPKKKKIRLESHELTKLLQELDKYQNPEMKLICEIAISSAMRRSEIIYLTWGQIFDGYIYLPKTKNGGDRKVFLTPDSKAVLAKMNRGEPDERIFKTYSTIAGFEGSFYKFMHSPQVKLPHITFHVFRKEAFSRFFEKLGGGSAAILAELLGVKHVDKFKNTYGNTVPKDFNTEEGILQNVGHSNLQVGVDHYLVLFPGAAPEGQPSQTEDESLGNASGEPVTATSVGHPGKPSTTKHYVDLLPGDHSISTQE